MNALRHADLARALVKANGGFEAAGLVCRLNKSQLQRCCNPKSGRFLPIDVVHDLEVACGRRIYTDALRHAVDGQVDLEDLIAEACELSEVAAAAQGLVRRSVADDDRLDALEKRDLRQMAGKVREQTSVFLNAVDQVAA